MLRRRLPHGSSVKTQRLCQFCGLKKPIYPLRQWFARRRPRLTEEASWARVHFLQVFVSFGPPTHNGPRPKVAVPGAGLT